MKRSMLTLLMVLLVLAAVAGTASAGARGYGMVFGVEGGPGHGYGLIK